MTDYLGLAKRAAASTTETTDTTKVPDPGRMPVHAPVDLDAARAAKGGIPDGPDERRLLAAGWKPKHGCGPLGLTIWANPETGFHSGQEAALHRLDKPLPRPAYPKLEGDREIGQ